MWVIPAVLAALALWLALPRLWRRLYPVPRRIGIVAGHWQSDSGATCPDGLREIDITLPVARQVIASLKAQGYDAELLGEYSSRLAGYRGLALVSLHADSCIAELSGFKIAGRSRGPAAGASALLVEALTRAYGAGTGLPFHWNTITPAMTQYHAFFQIAPGTPAAIVELGFMGGDRDLLTAHQDRVAESIAKGLLEFLNAGAGRQVPRL